MNKKEHQEYLKAFKAHTKDIASTKEKARKRIEMETIKSDHRKTLISPKM